MRTVFQDLEPVCAGFQEYFEIDRLLVAHIRIYPQTLPKSILKLMRLEEGAEIVNANAG